MVERTVPVGASRTSLRRLNVAGQNSRAFRLGDYDARFSLIQRHRAYLSLSTGMPWPERLQLAMAASARNREARRIQAEKDAAQRPYLESSRDL